MYIYIVQLFKMLHALNCDKECPLFVNRVIFLKELSFVAFGLARLDINS